MQNMLRSMLNGTCPTVEADLTTRYYLPKGKSISTKEWQVLASRAHIWIDYGNAHTEFSFPYVHALQPPILTPAPVNLPISPPPSPSVCVKPSRSATGRVL